MKHRKALFNIHKSITFSWLVTWIQKPLQSSNSRDGGEGKGKKNPMKFISSKTKFIFIHIPGEMGLQIFWSDSVLREEEACHILFLLIFAGRNTRTLNFVAGRGRRKTIGATAPIDYHNKRSRENSKLQLKVVSAKNCKIVLNLLEFFSYWYAKRHVGYNESFFSSVESHHVGIYIEGK